MWKIPCLNGHSWVYLQNEVSLGVFKFIIIKISEEWREFLRYVRGFWQIVLQTVIRFFRWLLKILIWRRNFPLGCVKLERPFSARVHHQILRFLKYSNSSAVLSVLAAFYSQIQSHLVVDDTKKWIIKLTRKICSIYQIMISSMILRMHNKERLLEFGFYVFIVYKHWQDDRGIVKFHDYLIK